MGEGLSTQFFDICTLDDVYKLQSSVRNMNETFWGKSLLHLMPFIGEWSVRFNYLFNKEYLRKMRTKKVSRKGITINMSVTHAAHSGGKPYLHNIIR